MRTERRKSGSLRTGRKSSSRSYGYRKSAEDRHRLVIDEEAAAVVRRIFELRRGGMAYGKIASVLNSEGILSPRWYWAKRYGNGSCKYANLWMYATVKNVLTNEVYTGNLIQNQTGSRSYKDDTMIYKPESEWVRHEALHEAIISPEVWNEVRPSTGKGRCSRRTTRRRSPSCSPASSSAPTAKHPFRATGRRSAARTARPKSTFPISAPAIRPPATARVPGTPSMR